MKFFAASLFILCLQYVCRTSAMGMLSLNQQSLVSSFLIAKQRHLEAPAKDVTLLPAKEEHESVEEEVAKQRSQYTETGHSQREKELLANMGRLEDQLEGYRQLGPSLQRHYEMQAATAKSLKALEAKAKRIEEMSATLWWDSKMLMCVVIIFGSALCGYVSFLHVRQNSVKSWPSSAKRIDAAEPKDSEVPHCEEDEQDNEVTQKKVRRKMTQYFSLDEKEDVLTPEEQWWIQPCGPRPSPSELNTSPKEKEDELF